MACHRAAAAAQWRGTACNDVHAVIYMQCRGEWKLARVASRCGIIVSQAGKWRHCVYLGRASTRPYIACVGLHLWGVCEGARWMGGRASTRPYIGCEGACGVVEGEIKKGGPEGSPFLLRGCVNYLTTNLAPFWIAIPLKFLDTF